ncbi:Capsular polysaccharide synthesis protein [Oribacterium sp. KHPX15]|uniref:capsular polysaccharide synthesis protein n=1 Tax=Oribacterium sp. KHPX15 TaxID=1855342 RepID=UPI00089C4E06|nr:capsular polysaccharide synthesis protein [Oribacterium sp. KHPX15]SEA56593.1 Capsular polysaccharide synthesis protein [Oribacterium sp. KHPX15]
MGLKETFEKQGGMNLIKQYARAGVLGTAIGEFLLLGKSRIALEILRLSTQLKTKQKLEKKYRYVLEGFDRKYDDSLPHESSKKVWICWFQGMEQAPELVKKCYESINVNLSDREIILITSENMKQYVQFPEYIMNKWKSGVITNTHLTDLLRLELLIKYGGLWLDATVFCSEQECDIPEYFFNSELFFYQSLKPGRDGKSTYISSWLMSAKTNNKVLMATRELCYEYWKREKQMLDYFLLHDFFSIVLDRYPEEWKKVVPRDNATPHILLLRLFDLYDGDNWKAIKGQTPFHKLSYKFNKIEEQKQDTFYKTVILKY